MKKNLAYKINRWSQITIGLIFIVLLGKHAEAATCDFPSWSILPKIVEVKVLGQNFALVFTVDDYYMPSQKGKRYLIHFDSKRGEFDLVNNEEIKNEIINNYKPALNKTGISIGEAFLLNDVRYRIEPFGITEYGPKGRKTFEIPGFLPEDLNLESEMVEGSFTQSLITQAVISGDWIIAAFEGGFVQGSGGQPNGIAFFSTKQKKWFVKSEPLLDLKVTSIIPLKERALIGTIRPGDLVDGSGGIFLADPKTGLVEKFMSADGPVLLDEFDKIEAYEVVNLGEWILVKGQYGVAVSRFELKEGVSLSKHDLKEKKEFLWMKDISPKGEIIDRLVPTKGIEKEQRNTNLARFYVLDRFVPSNKEKFLKTLEKDSQSTWEKNDYLLGDCPDYRFDLPVDALQYLDVEKLTSSKHPEVIATVVNLMGRSNDTKWLPILKKVTVTSPTAKKDISQAIQMLERLEKGIEEK